MGTLVGTFVGIIAAGTFVGTFVGTFSAVDRCTKCCCGGFCANKDGTNITTHNKEPLL